ncbi:NfeD family protein [Spirillospora sp. CA-253888]
MEPWVVWLLAAALLGLAELLTLTLALGLLAVAALAAGLAGAAGLPVALQVAVFCAGSVAGLAVVRPIARRHVRQPPPLRTGTAALVEGSEAVTPPYELAPGEEWPAGKTG